LGQGKEKKDPSHKPFALNKMNRDFWGGKKKERKARLNPDATSQRGRKETFSLKREKLAGRGSRR